MRHVISYIKRQCLWLVMLVLCLATMILLLYLNDISSNEILYGMLLMVFFFALFVAFDFAKYHHKCKQLEQLKQLEQFNLQNVPEDTDGIEAGYRELLEKLLIESAGKTNELENKRKDMTEYYSMWVHQIKTPIAAMRLLLQTYENKQAMLEQSEENRNLGHEIEAIQAMCMEERKELEEELFRIEQYVEMALQYLRLDSNTNDFVFQRHPLDKMVKEAVHKYAKLFIRKKIALHYDGLHQIVLTDEKWTEFVIEQVLSNAVKYTQTGSVTISAKETEDAVFLVIEDTGIGIREEDLPRVCEKGYTGYNGHSDKRSTGIGLYLCSRVLKKLGHTIEITSVVGKGTTVKIGFYTQGKDV